jgi:hypothetical protein
MLWLPKQLTWSRERRERYPLNYEKGDILAEISPFVDRLARIIYASCAGLALITPMLIMAINTSKTKSIITASVSILLFAIGASLGVKLPNTEIFIATATYAAVLVVFLGVTS